MKPLAAGTYASRNRVATRWARHFASWPAAGLPRTLEMYERENRMLACRIMRFAFIAATVALAVPCAAQTPEQFFGGTNIDLVIGYPPGGSNDTYARVLARHLGKHIPGNPAVVPKNMPG